MSDIVDAIDCHNRLVELNEYDTVKADDHDWLYCNRCDCGVDVCILDKPQKSAQEVLISSTEARVRS